MWLAPASSKFPLSPHHSKVSSIIGKDLLPSGPRAFAYSVPFAYNNTIMSCVIPTPSAPWSG